MVSPSRSSLIHSELEASLASLRLCLKNKNIKFSKITQQVNTLAVRLKDLSFIVGYLVQISYFFPLFSTIIPIKLPMAAQWTPTIS